jgi:CO/xanthine dehydrogenase FAD-binding subunit
METSGPEEYLAPSTLAEALEAIAAGDALVVAGGTDLMLQTKPGGRIPYRRKLVNIRRIAELRGVSEVAGRINIGALTTITDILENKLLHEVAPVLPETANRFASSQIRNIGTLGGNICNASPAGDMILPLLVLDAEVELASWKNGMVTRSLPLAGFFTGPGRSVKQANELLTEISFARPEAGFAAHFAKSGPRPALEIATVSAAFGAILRDGKLSKVRIALGAVGPTPLRAKRTEAFLEGRRLDPRVMEEAAVMAADEASPIDDIRASAWYRKHLISVFIRRLLENDSQG